MSDTLEKDNDEYEELPDEKRQIVVCDINPDMLAVGKDRAKSKFTRKQNRMVCDSKIFIFIYTRIFIHFYIWSFCYLGPQSLVLLKEMQNTYHLRTTHLIFIQSPLDSVTLQIKT